MTNLIRLAIGSTLSLHSTSTRGASSTARRSSPRLTSIRPIHDFLSPQSYTPCVPLAAYTQLTFRSPRHSRGVCIRVSHNRAIGSTPLSQITLSGSGEYFTVDELFPGRWREYDQRPDSFAEQHAKFAKIAGEAALDRGEHLLECLQCQLALNVHVACN